MRECGRSQILPRRLEFTGCDAARPGGDTKPALDAVKSLFELMSAHKPEAYSCRTHARIAARGVDPRPRRQAYVRELDAGRILEVLCWKNGLTSPSICTLRESAHWAISPWLTGVTYFLPITKPSHCGMNSFHVVRTADGWKLGNSISTIEPAGCTEAEKAMTEPAAVSK